MELGKITFLGFGAVVGGLLGFFLASLGDEGAGTADPAPTEVTTENGADGSVSVDPRIAVLEERLRESILREQKLRAELSAEAEASTETPTPDSTPFERKGSSAIHLESVDDAERLAAQLMQNRDIEGMWLLGMELLGHGEEGFAKVVELMGWLEANMQEFEGAMRLWRDEEIIIGRFLHSLGEHDEELLRFGLYLDRIAGDGLPKPLQELHRELDDEIGAVLLGYYQGDDPEIFDGYTRFLAGSLEGANARNARDAVRALSQIPTDGATDLLIDMLQKGDPQMARTVVPALAWQGSERALPVLRELLRTTTDERMIQMIEGAIRLLESR